MLKIIACCLICLSFVVFILFCIAWMCFTEDQYEKINKDIKEQNNS